MPPEGPASLPAVAGPGRSPLALTQRRWQILYQQMHDGHEPCFQSDRRYACGEHTCRWRGECLALRAEWKR